MEVIVVLSERKHGGDSVVIEKNLQMTGNLPAKNVNESLGCDEVICFVMVGHWGLAPVIPDGSDINLEPFQMRGMVEFDAVGQADVADAELSAVRCCPFPLDRQEQGHHSRMGEMSGACARLTIDVIPCFLGCLREHEIAPGILGLDFQHGSPYATRLVARSQPPDVLPLAPPPIFCWLYFHFTFEYFKPRESCKTSP